MLLIAVWLFYPGFTACDKDSVWCSVMYWTTESGGRTGSFILILAVSLAFGFTATSLKSGILNALRTLLVLIILLSALAFANENLIKTTTRIARPSHTYIFKQTNTTVRLDSIYTLVLDQRRQFFQNLIDHDTVHFKSIDERILHHWVEEAGYSFPSGHSFNAFLIGSFIAFAIYEYLGRKITIWSFIPLFWAGAVAYSRVAVGSHAPLDVSVGSALGLIIANTLLSIHATRRLILPNTPRFTARNS